MHPRRIARLATVALLVWMGGALQRRCSAAEGRPEGVEGVSETRAGRGAEAEGASRLKPGLLHLDVGEVYLELESGYETQRVRSTRRGALTQRFQRQDFSLREALGLTLRGDVVDPGLIDWTAGLEFGLTQDRFREEFERLSEQESRSGLLLNYDVTVDVLKGQPVSLHAYARRRDDRVPRRFLPTLDEEVTEAGASVLVLTGPVTTELGFSFEDVDRSGNRRRVDDEHLRTSRFYLDSRWEISDSQSLHVRWDHEQEDVEYQGSLFDFDTRRDELRLDHTVAFGPENRHRLDTYLRYNDEQGDLARDEIELVERLSLRHTRDFETVWRYGFYRFDEHAIRVDLHQLDVQALYRPHENLQISLEGLAAYERVDGDIETGHFGGTIDIQTRNPTPWGTLRTNLAVGYDHLRSHGDAGERWVRSEAHALSDVVPVFLRQQNVVLTSIVAHTGSRTRIYVPGVDYTILPWGRRVMVRRLPGGRIPLNGVVYFDYRYLVPARAEIGTLRLDASIEHVFTNGWTPYYYVEVRRQDVDTSRETLLEEDNTNRHRLGLRYDSPRVSASGELEYFDDSIEPYNAAHLVGRVNLLSDAERSLDASAEVSYYRFRGGLDRRQVWWALVDVTGRARLTDYLEISGGAAYRWEDDSVDGTTDGLDVQCGLLFRRGYLSVELTAEYDLLSVADSRDDTFALYLNVRRDLTHLFARREGL